MTPLTGTVTFAPLFSIRCAYEGVQQNRSNYKYSDGLINFLIAEFTGRTIANAKLVTSNAVRIVTGRARIIAPRVKTSKTDRTASISVPSTNTSKTDCVNPVIVPASMGELSVPICVVLVYRNKFKTVLIRIGTIQNGQCWLGLLRLKKNSLNSVYMSILWCFKHVVRHFKAYKLVYDQNAKTVFTIK